MLWTEILGENVGVTHVHGQKVLFPIGDPSRGELHQAKQVLKRRQTERYMRQERERLAAKLEQQARVRDRLKGTEYERML